MMAGFATVPAAAHPHVFAEARLEITIQPDGSVEKLAHVWRFDDLFSSTVLMEFDKKGTLKLDNEELDELSNTINTSIAEYKYFQTVTQDGKDVTMAKPEHLIADLPDNQLIVLFESKPAKPLKLQPGHKVSFGVYDPTFYSAIDYLKDEDLVVKGMPAGCTSAVIRPDPDEAIAMNQQSLTQAFFDEAAAMTNDVSKFFATRIEITCK
ncbi:DUF1007 family protein [Pseudochrobactrum sp. HB0163]|uniref:DUF1007 family protein n=1 Tax=Pseudochrobactrum sp. HB0163 TaxID=3450708 RepID=UPI003F6E1E0C